MRHLHAPLWLAALNRPTTPTFVALFSLENFSRASLVTVIPLVAHARLGDAQKVSLLYFFMSFVGILASFAVPWLVSHISRRGVLSLGAAAFAGAMSLFTADSLPTLVGAMALFLFAGACFEIGLSLFLQDHVGRKDMGRFEPVRIFWAGAAWALGPLAGVFLRAHVGPWAPFALSGCTVLVLISYFWYLRVTENPAVTSRRRSVTNPVRYLPRFLRQPRLRLAWLLAFGRAGWWNMFYVYGPIYVVSSGLSEQVAGMLASAGTAFVMLVPLIARVGRRFGLRHMMMAGYVLAGAVTIAVAVSADSPLIGVALLVGAALCAVPIDAAGNVPFLRAVHDYERPEMTTVFVTYRYAQQLFMPGVYAALLNVFALPAVFATAGTGMVGLGMLCRYIPRRLR